MRGCIIIVICGLFSCSFNESNSFVTTLTSPNNCWVFYSYPEEQLNNGKVIVGGCTKFSDDYTFTPFVLKDKTPTEIRSLDKGISNRGAWNFNPYDSTFYVDGQIFKVIMYNVDTITVMNDKNHLQKMVRTELDESK
jgi:hypothetical protein